MRTQKIMVVLGSTRPGRKGEKIAEWFMKIASQSEDIIFNLVDVKDLGLPLLDEPVPAAAGKYEHEHTKNWAKQVGEHDGFIFVTPEYNFGMPAALKNALDFVGKEWAIKPIAFVGYGSVGAARAVQQFRSSVIDLNMVPINAQVAINLFDQLDENGEFVPTENNDKRAKSLIEKMKWWSEGLTAMRENSEKA